jgi:hypothetical protein
LSNKLIAFGFVAVGAVCALASVQPVHAVGAQPEPKIVELAGLEWHGSLGAALQIAKKENKPVLHLQMFGKLDDAYC